MSDYTSALDILTEIFQCGKYLGKISFVKLCGEVCEVAVNLKSNHIYHN
jgi:hypothetical protein